MLQKVPKSSKTKLTEVGNVCGLPVAPGFRCTMLNVQWLGLLTATLPLPTVWCRDIDCITPPAVGNEEKMQ